MKIKYIDLACSETFTIGQQYDHKAFGIVFSNLKYEGDLYIKIKSKDYDNFIPLQDDTFIVGLPLTLNYGLIDAQLYSKKENTDEYVELSKVFHMRIKKSLDGLSPELPYPVDPNIELLYDDILALKKDIEQKLENGAFNGKDGVGIKSIEKTGSEGLVDTYTITLTDDSTFVYYVTNGRDGIDGIDGKSAYELAVENGFKGTEEEWLQSLDYEHSDEFTQLATQVRTDAEQSAKNASKAENAMNEANTTAQENVKAINQASTNAQNAITTAKGNAVQAVQSAQQTAENAIGTKQTEAVQAVDTAKTSATQEIAEQKESVVSAITQERSEAIEAIETGRTDALNDIKTAKDNAIEEIENTGVPLEDIEKLAIKETATGNPTIISDSADWRLQKLNVYGQSQQDSTTGKNLLNPTGATKEGWNIALPNFKLEVGKQYTYTAPILEGSKACGLYAKASNTQLAPYRQSGKTHTFTVAEEADFSQGIFLAGVSEDALTLGNELTAMVELGSVATEFEPYTGGKPSPNPDYPQEIISKEVSEIKVTNGADLSQTITLTEPITLRGIPVSSGGNVTIDGQQYVSDVICEKDGVIGTERNDGFIENYTNENVGDIYISTTGELSQGASVLYPLSEPTFEPLPEEIQAQYKALKSYYPNTVIQTGCWNDVEYVADTKLYIDKKLSEISSQLTELKADTLLLGGM